jgi:hypothetical protein
MAKTWVLHTETKGTGANMVPLERTTKRSSTSEPVFVPRKPRPRTPEAPGPRAPRRFRVVDVMTRQLLVDDARAAEAVEALRRARSIVDVNVFVWNEDGERWRMLTLPEQRTMFDLAATQRRGDVPRVALTLPAARHAVQKPLDRRPRER